MNEHKGRTSGKAAQPKRTSGSKHAEKARSTGSQKAEEQSTEYHPAGLGGPAQDAGGPEHHGAEAYEDRNP